MAAGGWRNIGNQPAIIWRQRLWRASSISVMAWRLQPMAKANHLSRLMAASSIMGVMQWQKSNGGILSGVAS